MCRLLGYEGTTREGCKEFEAGKREFRGKRWKRIAEMEEMQCPQGLKAGEQLRKECGEARCKSLVL